MIQHQTSLFAYTPPSTEEDRIRVNSSIDILDSIRSVIQCDVSHAVKIRIFLPSDFDVNNYDSDELLQFYREAQHDYDNREE